MNDIFCLTVRFIIGLFYFVVLGFEARRRMAPSHGRLQHPYVGVSITEALKLMSDDTHDDMFNLVDPSEYEDPVSQRAMAFCHVAKLADTVQDEAVKELCLTMLRKLNASIRTPSNGGPPVH